jgi:hypothetical protein
MTKISNQYSLTNILTADLANSRLGINNVSPAYSLDLTGTARTSGATYLATASGNVGIGTTSPANALSIDEGTATASYLQFTAGTTTGQLATDGFEVGIDASANAIINQQENLPLMIYTNATERMRITADGNVGIGTTTIGTDYKLAVYGTNSLMTFQNANTGQTNGDGFAVGSFGNVDAYLYNYENANMIFGTNATERMRLTSGGNLLVGTTTNQGEKVYVNGGVRATGGMYASLFEGEFGIVCASTPYAGATISYNLAALDPGIYLINAYMMRGGGGINETYSVMWYYMHLSGFGGGSDAISAIYNNPGPNNNNGGITLSGYTVNIGWGGARGPAAVTATKLRDAY